MSSGNSNNNNITSGRGNNANNNSSTNRPQLQRQASTCAICQYPHVEPTITTPCGHRFCKKCITPWLGEGHYKCPVCRAEFATSFLTANGYVAQEGTWDRRMQTLLQDPNYVETQTFRHGIIMHFISLNGWWMELPDLSSTTPFEQWMREANVIVRDSILHEYDQWAPEAEVDMWFEDVMREYNDDEHDRPYGRRFPVMRYPQYFQGRFYQDFLDWEQLQEVEDSLDDDHDRNVGVANENQTGEEEEPATEQTEVQEPVYEEWLHEETAYEEVEAEEPSYEEPAADESEDAVVDEDGDSEIEDQYDSEVDEDGDSEMKDQDDSEVDEDGDSEMDDLYELGTDEESDSDLSD